MKMVLPSSYVTAQIGDQSAEERVTNWLAGNGCDSWVPILIPSQPRTMRWHGQRRMHRVPTMSNSEQRMARVFCKREHNRSAFWRDHDTAFRQTQTLDAIRRIAGNAWRLRRSDRTRFSAQDFWKSIWRNTTCSHFPCFPPRTER